MKSRQLLRLVVCLTGLWFFSLTPAVANTAPEELDTLPLLINKAVMSYQMFKLDQSNPLYSQQIDSAKKRIRQSRQSLRQVKQKDIAKSPMLETINHNISSFLDALSYNESQLLGGGYESYSTVRKMYQSSQVIYETSQKLYKKIIKAHQFHVSPTAHKSRKLAENLQFMSANYIRQVASITGTSFGKYTDQPINKLAEAFSKDLAGLTLTDKADVTLHTKLRQVNSQWTFIKQSMLNYKHNTVPYLVYRYTGSMVDDLLDIANGYGAATSTRVSTTKSQKEAKPAPAPKATPASAS